MLRRCNGGRSSLPCSRRLDLRVDEASISIAPTIDAPAHSVSSLGRQQGKKPMRRRDAITTCSSTTLQNNHRSYLAACSCCRHHLQTIACITPRTDGTSQPKSSRNHTIRLKRKTTHVSLSTWRQWNMHGRRQSTSEKTSPLRSIMECSHSVTG